MSNIENNDVDPVERLKELFQRRQGRETTLDDDAIASLIDDAEDVQSEEDWMLAILTAEREEDSEDEEETEDADAKNVAIVKASEAINWQRGRDGVAAIDKSPDVAASIEDYAATKRRAKLLVLHVYDALVKAVPADVLASWPVPGTVATGMDGVVSANNPDKYKRYVAGGRIATRSFFIDEVHDKMEASQKLLQQINAAQTAYDNAKNSNKEADAKQTLDDLNTDRKNRAEAIRRAYKLWLQFRAADEYEDVTVVQKREALKDKAGKEIKVNGKAVMVWRNVSAPIGLVKTSDPSAWNYFSAPQFERLAFDKAEKIVARMKRADKTYDAFQILMDTRKRPPKDPATPIGVEDKTAMSVLMGLSAWLAKESAGTLWWKTLKAGGTKAEKDMAATLQAHINEVYKELQPFVLADQKAKEMLEREAQAMLRKAEREAKELSKARAS